MPAGPVSRNTLVVVHINTDVVRRNLTRLELAHDSLRRVVPVAADARTHDLADLQATIVLASKQVEGNLTVAAQAIADLHSNVDACVTAYLESDHKSAGTFHGLD